MDARSPPTRTMNGSMRRPPIKRQPASALPVALGVTLTLLAVGGAVALWRSRGAVSATSPPPPSTPDGLVTHLVRSHPVVVFSKTYCPYCRRAKATLTSATGAIPGAPPPHIVELDERADGEALQQALAARTGRRTVPNVWVGGVAVGGGDEVAALDEAGQLDDLLRRAQGGGKRP
ncbi:hypothetical protein MMPV_001254 [Pyropia vietnamensis]